MHARVHEVLEEDFLRALLLVDARIVRQVVGDRLVAVTEIAGAKRRVHHFHRRDVAAHRRAILRRERQRLLDVGHPALVEIEVAALGVVADHHRGAVRRLHAEQIVEVRLVRREDDVDLRALQIDPRDVARVVVVGEERVGAQPQKAREALVGRKVGGPPQRVGRLLRERRIGVVVVPPAERTAVAADRRVGIEQHALRVGVRGHVRVDGRARQIGGVERVPRRHLLGADERLVLVHQVPAAAVDEQVMAHAARGGRVAGGERLVERETHRVALAPVHALEGARRDHELIDRLALAIAQRRRVERHADRLELRDATIEIGNGRLQHRCRVDVRQIVSRRARALERACCSGCDAQKRHDRSQRFHVPHSGTPPRSRRSTRGPTTGHRREAATISETSTIRTAYGGSATARTSAFTICARVTRPRRSAVSRVAASRRRIAYIGTSRYGQ